MDGAEYILKMEGIRKEFPGVVALDNVSLHVKRGTVHALLGENGAGKSTLMKILIGIYDADEGRIAFKGRVEHISNTHQALKLGISMIHQELNPVPDMTVGDNVFLGREPVNKFTGLVSQRKINQKTQDLFDRLEITAISPKLLMKNLSTAQMQMVEIVKAVSYSADLIIMDEPTSAISEVEVEKLFKIIRSLRNREIAIIYISHKMDEIFKIADEITVLRDGKYICTDKAKNLNREKLIKLMVGRELKDFFHKKQTVIGDVVFEVKNLRNEGLFEGINFKVHRGEILGIGGLMGSGRTEIVETILGIRGAYTGELNKYGKSIKIKNPRDAIKNKIALVTEDRKMLGLFLCLPIRHNISISWLDNLSKFSWVQTKKEKEKCNELLEKLRIKTTSLDMLTETLSGGNQQKVVLAKWLLTVPDLLIFDEPTRGIDVGAKVEVYNIMVGLAKEGKAIIMISSEMPELLGMSDRIIVVCNGRITGELNREEASQEKILDLASVAREE